LATLEPRFSSQDPIGSLWTLMRVKPVLLSRTVVTWIMEHWGLSSNCLDGKAKAVSSGVRQRFRFGRESSMVPGEFRVAFPLVTLLSSIYFSLIKLLNSLLYLLTILRIIQLIWLLSTPVRFDEISRKVDGYWWIPLFIVSCVFWLCYVGCFCSCCYTRALCYLTIPDNEEGDVQHKLSTSNACYLTTPYT
jgi:hypothetical protein